MTLPTVKKRTRRYPVSSFGPEVMAALIKGSNEKVILRFRQDGSKTAMSQAIYMQHRIHTLRAAMREAKHEHAELVSRARASRVWGVKAGEEHASDTKGDKYVELHIYPNDSQFSEVFKEAGVVVEEVKINLNEEEEKALQTLESGPEPLSFDPYKDFKGPNDV